MFVSASKWSPAQSVVFTWVMSVAIAASLANPANAQQKGAASAESRAVGQAEPAPAPATGHETAVPGSVAPDRVKAYLGVTVGPVPGLLRAHLRNRLQPAEGLAVVAVAAQGPAARAGLAAGDIIVGCDDEAVGNPTELVGLIAMSAPGKPVELTVLQLAKRVRIPVTLEAAPAPVPAAGAPHQLAGKTPAPPALRNKFFTLSTASGSAMLAGNGERFSLDLQYRNEQLEPRAFRWRGTAHQLQTKLAEVGDVPGDLQTALQRQLSGQEDNESDAWPFGDDSSAERLSPWPWYHRSL